MSLGADGPRRGREAFSLHVPRPPLRCGLLLYLREKASRPRRGSALEGNVAPRVAPEADAHRGAFCSEAADFPVGVSRDLSAGVSRQAIHGCIARASG